MPGLEAAAKIFGSDKPPKEVMQRYTLPLLGPLRNLNADALSALRRGGAAAESAFNAGTERQTGLQGEQEGVLRGLLSKALGSDPNQLLKNVGNTLFGFIDPNVVSPLARFDVNTNMLANRARGINSGSIDSTSERLRNARVASGRYYDVARQVYGALPNAFTGVYNAGVNDDERARGYIPDIMQGYRNIDLAPLIPAMARSQLANMGAQNVTGNAMANKAATYGYKQPQNIWDKLGEADKVLWAGLKDAIQMASSVTGMLGGGGAGGLLGGLMGGGGGGGGGGVGTGAPGGAGGSQPVQRFMPYAPASPGPVPASPGYYPGPVSPYGPAAPQTPYGGANPYPYLG